jgi:hypothetical protein
MGDEGRRRLQGTAGAVIYSGPVERRVHLLLHARILGNETRSCGL